MPSLLGEASPDPHANLRCNHVATCRHAMCCSALKAPGCDLAEGCQAENCDQTLETRVRQGASAGNTRARRVMWGNHSSLSPGLP